MVDPSLCGRLTSSTIVEGWSCTRGSTRIWMMGVVDVELNEVESLEHIRGGVVCTRGGLVFMESGEMWLYSGMEEKGIASMMIISPADWEGDLVRNFF
jgi:hypothetical protein